MKKLKIILASFVLSLSTFANVSLIQAQEYRGIIPAAEQTTCDTATASTTDLGTKIKCGTVGLNDVPAMAVYLIQFILTLAGSIAVIMIMIGAFQYMAGGVTDDKERGKKTIIYALGGLIVAFMAWWIVELIQVWITS